MQGCHKRHKQLERARYEMIVHRRRMFARKINNTIMGINKIAASVTNGMRRSATTFLKELNRRTVREPREIEDIATDMFKEKHGLIK